MQPVADSIHELFVGVEEVVRWTVRRAVENLLVEELD